MVLEIHLYLQPPPPTSFQILRTPFLSFNADHCEDVRRRQKKRGEKKKKSHKSSSAHSHKDSGIAHAVWRAVNEITFLCLQNTHYYHELRELCH